MSGRTTFLEKKMQKLILGIRPHDLNLIKEPGDSQLTGSGKRIRVTGPKAATHLAAC